MTELHYQPSRLLKIQVGHLLAESGGVKRDVVFDIPVLKVADDLLVNYLRGTLHLTRNTRGILIEGALDTQVVTECSRCLDEARVPLTITFQELFVYPASPEAEFTVPETGLVDLSPLVREEVLLDLPLNATCKADCKGLCMSCGQNFNHGTCHCADEKMDPRFAALLGLRNDMRDQAASLATPQRKKAR